MFRSFNTRSRVAACVRPLGPIAGAVALLLLLAARAAPEAAEALVLPGPCPKALATPHAAPADHSVDQSGVRP